MADNSAGVFGGGIYCLTSSSPVITDCTFTGNATFHGGAIGCVDCSYPLITSCTIAANHGEVGSGIHAWDSWAMITSSIIAFNTGGQAVTCQGMGGSTLECCDIFGNVGGDWVDCIESQSGLDGNISIDPLFCDPSLGNFRLQPDSPCSPEFSPVVCELIGACPCGCLVTQVAAETVAAVRPPILVRPNPLRAGAVVEWDNREGGAATLRLYDALGRLVRADDLGVRGRGHQRVWWELGPGDGRDHPCGVYFVELTSPVGQHRAARIVITR